MTTPSAEAGHPRYSLPTDVFQLRVSLLYVDPAIWRRILVRQDVLLPRLHSILQVVMGWTDSHLHQFRVGDVLFAEPDGELEPEAIDYLAIALNQIAPHAGSNVLYEYDFGDGWEHLIEVEEELRVENVKGGLPRCVAGERAGPPEDVGGPSGYTRFLEAIRNPDDKEYEEYREWVGARYDPGEFSLDRVNRGLGKYTERPRANARRAR